MIKILAVADEVDETLSYRRLGELAPDLVVSCGDLPFDYLEFIVDTLNVPLLFVPGNHDPDLDTPNRLVSPYSLRHLGAEPAGPRGAVNADGRFHNAGGLRVAGLGGSVRYSDGPHQYTQGEMRRRGLRLELRAWLGRRGIDLFLAHAPPLGLGDESDPAHQGFRAFHRLIRKLAPRLMVHGHVHPYGQERPDRHLGATRIVNVIPHRLLEIPP